MSILSCKPFFGDDTGLAALGFNIKEDKLHHYTIRTNVALLKRRGRQRVGTVQQQEPVTFFPGDDERDTILSLDISRRGNDSIAALRLCKIERLIALCDQN